MKKYAVIFLSVALISCISQQENGEPKSEIRDNLPVADRDLLLSPLESSMDDLAAITLYDASLDVLKDQWTKEAHKLSTKIYLNGSDTQAIVAELSSDETPIERHEYFYNRKGIIFKSTHLFEGKEPKYKEVKFYFEDNGAQLSVYARLNYDQRKAPEVWTPVCLTREEELFLANRAKTLIDKFSITRQ